MDSAKNRLQEYFQKRKLALPTYETICLTLTPSLFRATVEIDGQKFEAEGSRKKEAEKAAAEKALDYILKYQNKKPLAVIFDSIFFGNVYPVIKGTKADIYIICCRSDHVDRYKDLPARCYVKRFITDKEPTAGYMYSLITLGQIVDEYSNVIIVNMVEGFRSFLFKEKKFTVAAEMMRSEGYNVRVCSSLKELEEHLEIIT